MFYQSAQKVSRDCSFCAQTQESSIAKRGKYHEVSIRRALRLVSCLIPQARNYTDDFIDLNGMTTSTPPADYTNLWASRLDETNVWACECSTN